jgi:membrane-associated protease RseP (regulator of RpoE activity)
MSEWQRILLVVGLIVSLIVIHELGHFLAAKSLRIPVRAFGIGIPLAALGIKRDIYLGWRLGETEFRLEALPFGGYVAFPDEEPDGGYDPADPRLLSNRPLWQRLVVISGGVVFNYIGAFLILLGTASFIGIPELKVGDVQIARVIAGRPAEQAGLQVGDLVRRVGTREVRETEEFVREIRGHAGTTVPLELMRGSSSVTIDVTPGRDGLIGVSVQPSSIERQYIHPENPFAAAWTQQARLTSLTVDGLVKLVTGRLAFQDLGGVVEIGRAGSYVAKRDVRDLLPFAALISISLAIMNMLPIPALDGGQALFMTLEAIAPKLLTKERQQMLNSGGFTVLMLFMLAMLLKDLVSPIRYPDDKPPAPVQTPAPPSPGAP